MKDTSNNIFNGFEKVVSFYANVKLVHLSPNQYFELSIYVSSQRYVLLARLSPTIFIFSQQIDPNFSLSFSLPTIR